MIVVFPALWIEKCCFVPECPHGIPGFKKFHKNYLYCAEKTGRKFISSTSTKVIHRLLMNYCRFISSSGHREDPGM
jgi:hypothetical protein